MGSAGIAEWIAQVAFIGLFTWGWVTGELGVKGRIIFFILGCAAWLAVPLLPNGHFFVTSALAVVDIAMVFAIFKGDVRFW